MKPAHPWSNRISGGGSYLYRIFHALQPDLPGERYPIHGNAFQHEWVGGATASDGVTLGLEGDGSGPYRSAAEVRYAVTDKSLDIALRVVNRAAIGAAALWTWPASLAAPDGGHRASGTGCRRLLPHTAPVKPQISRLVR